MAFRLHLEMDMQAALVGIAMFEGTRQRFETLSVFCLFPYWHCMALVYMENKWHELAF
jgi:hypothetical protein